MTGLPEFAASRTLIAAAAALAAVLVVAFGVVAIVRLGDQRSEPVATYATTSSPATSPSSPRMSRLMPRSSAPEITGMLEVSGPECDAGVINADLLYPNSGARIIDCGSGWAVMASAVSGDPYWVAYSDGRWRRVGDVSIYLGTCPDEAIALGAPAWMAQKHLGDCSSRGRSAPPALGAATVASTPTPRATTVSPATTSPTRTSTRTGSPSEESTSSPASTSRTTATTPASSTPTQVPTSTSPGNDAAADGG
ncbi:MULTISPECIES: hypothetical protein [unclassified Dietzia]|uniref:hypothetical protein n=1 Tax=unclassified Dietzia TaxID=2617939 RepID=UPI00080599E0|nr:MULTISPECIES: hypothetical protein [unclassified Dietzia]OAV77406.1 hypothetical protein AYO52_16350 [Dietzia sp. 111N12-1]